LLLSIENITFEYNRHCSAMNLFVTGITRRTPLMEQQLIVRSQHMSSYPVFSGVRVAQSFSSVL